MHSLHITLSAHRLQIVSAAVFVVFGTQPETWQIWRQSSRRVKQTMSQMSVQLQPRPSPRHLLPMISPSCTSSRNHFITPSMCSQRHPSFIPSSRPHSLESRVSKQSAMQSHERLQHSFYPPVPALPPAIACRDEREGMGEILSPALTPALTNNSQCTPTSPCSPDPAFPLTDHTRRLGDLKRKPSVHPHDLARPPRLDQHDVNATMFDPQLIGPIDDISLSTDPATDISPGQARTEHATAHDSHEQAPVTLPSDGISSVLPTSSLVRV